MKSKFFVLICWYEMLGGILGFLLTLYLMLFSPNSVLNPEVQLSYRMLFLCIYLVFLVLYGLSFIAGFLLRKEKKVGIILSIIVQVFQIPYIESSAIVYNFISGLQLGAAVTISPKIFSITALFYLGSQFFVKISSHSDYIKVGVNIISIVVINYLRRIQIVPTMDNEQTELENADADGLNETKDDNGIDEV